MAGQPTKYDPDFHPQEVIRLMKDQGYWWINNYLAYFLPQRPLLFAFPVTLLILGLLYFGWKRNKRLYFILAGLLAGTLTIIQAHSLLVVFLLSAFFSNLKVLSLGQRQSLQAKAKDLLNKFNYYLIDLILWENSKRRRLKENHIIGY